MVGRVAVGFSLLVVVAAVAVGPLGVDGLQRAPDVADNAAVTVESAPSETVTLERGRFGSGRYHLDAPPAVVTVADVRGSPRLRYTIDVPRLWLTATSRYELAGRSGTQRLVASPTTVSPDRVEQRRYDAILSIWVREGDRDRDLLQRQITVVVRS